MGKPGGSGGQSGSVDFPDLYKKLHRVLLDGEWHVDNLAGGGHDSADYLFGIETVSEEEGLENYGGVFNYILAQIDAGLSPFDATNAYDPKANPGTIHVDSPLGKMNAAISSFSSMVSALSYLSDWGGVADVANAKMASLFPAIGPNVESIMDTTEGKLSTFSGNAVNDMLTKTENIVDAAIAKAQGASIDVDDLVDAFEQDSQDAYFRSINRFTGGMVDVNAVHTSSFVIGLGLMEAQFLNSIMRFRAELESGQFGNILNAYVNTSVGLSTAQIQAFLGAYSDYLRAYMQNASNRSLTLAQSMQLMAGMLANNLDVNRSLATLKVEKERFTIGSLVEQSAKDLEMDILDARWPLELYQAGGNMLSAIHGTAVTHERTTNPGSGGWSGALSGSVAGAGLGNQLLPGGIGAGVGAIAGAIMGYQP